MQDFVDIPVPSRFRLGELFKDNNFKVPLYQRNFAWKKEEVDDFWNDLMDIVSGERSSHFFGQIVTFQNENHIQEIIDGQQRLTTSSLFLAVIRDVANELFESNRDHLMNASGDSLRDVMYNVKKYLRGEDNSMSSLMLQEDSEDPDKSLSAFFIQLVHQGHDVAETEPERKLVSAYKMLHQQIISAIKQEKTITDRVNLLKTIFECFTDRFYIVMISAPSQKDAFIIFETLNSRGKDLKASDMIKNHLMYVSGDSMKAANGLWNIISQRLKEDSNRITKFIRTYWAARSKLVTEAKLYRSLSQKIKTENDVKNFLEDLGHLVDLYAVLESPMSPKSNLEYFSNDLLLEKVDILNRLQVKLYYPVMLSMKIADFNEEEMLKVVNKLLSVFIRHRTIIHDGTNTLESGFSNVAEKIYSGELSSVQMINEWMDDNLLRTDDEVRSSFDTLKKDGGLRGAKKWTIVYLLSELYDEDLYEKAFDNDNYQLVHISENQVSSELLDYLGNWTMIEKTLKTEFDKAKSINEQQALLNKSDLTENHDIANLLPSWSDSAVRGRQDRLKKNVTVMW
ncbi:DUF262 domain-containing protein [Secundilactobacillus paracollinoides]|uniref:GmrSD restriction endonucleases N-terminal domain-containing protein n=1 Tax=Secundilactobacillus paracollinoides TaxID=240427 RepID=A0A1B2IY65_9LACO|nr:DUF262 domain-containing protein [Secundilactobacillus paracollinoides]ANZ61094.1 hypothetical protein AYR61_06900 [Secundilactobacillus paracollinoides]ANZ67016.1 hypothetical protein AYR63_07650 [Secundilactobacillus paracollinoides]